MRRIQGMHILKRSLVAVALFVATLPAQTGLEVIAAYYGSDRSFVDVTATVRAQAQPDGLGLTVGITALGGDPFPGQLKTMRIYYKLNGQFQQGEWKDSENVLIGRLNTGGLNSGGRNTGMRGGGRPMARERTNSTAPLTITQATYGAGNRTVDVTTLLQSRIQRDQLDFDVPGSLLGDPAPGLLKELVVSYRWNGQVREARVRDGDRLRLPNGTPVATGLKIVSAQYGSGTRVMDVTALLEARISADRLVMLVENNSLGGDPLRGADKVLNVVYEWNGQRYNVSAKEGQTLRLPADPVVSAVSASGSASARTPTDGVCLYPGQNFQGTPFCAALGQDQATFTGTWGSLRLFGTARQVDLFETANFTGRTVRLTAELADLSRAGGGFFSVPAPWATTPASLRLTQ